MKDKPATRLGTRTRQGMALDLHWVQESVGQARWAMQDLGQV